jgi:predicted nucleotidyltransferase
MLSKAKVSEMPKIVCQLLPDVAAVYIFGSTGSKFEHAESDIDLAVLCAKKLMTTEKFAVQEKIAQLLHRDVDLIDLAGASTVLRFQIVSTGKLIFCQNKQACDFFETLVYSSYIRFNDERREILDDVKKRGRIFNG